MTPAVRSVSRRRIASVTGWNAAPGDGAKAACSRRSVNILNISRSDRLVRVCAEFRSIGLANRFELACLDEPGVTIYGWVQACYGCPRMGHFRGLMRSVSQ